MYESSFMHKRQKKMLDPLIIPFLRNFRPDMKLLPAGKVPWQQAINFNPPRASTRCTWPGKCLSKLSSTNIVRNLFHKIQMHFFPFKNEYAYLTFVSQSLPIHCVIKYVCQCSIVRKWYWARVDRVQHLCLCTCCYMINLYKHSGTKSAGLSGDGSWPYHMPVVEVDLAVLWTSIYIYIYIYI